MTACGQVIDILDEPLQSPNQLAEKIVGRQVQGWLEQQSWDCYPEAQLRQRGPRADLIAVKGPLVWALETKLNMSLQVIEQALRWKLQGALYTSVVTLKPKRKRQQRFVWHSEFVDRSFRREGLGLILFDRETGQLQETIPPSLQRYNYQRSKWIRSGLDKRMKAFSPGSQSSDGYSSPAARSLEDALAYLKKVEFCTLDEMLKVVKTHFRVRAKARKFLIRQLALQPSVMMHEKGYEVAFSYQSQTEQLPQDTKNA